MIDSLSQSIGHTAWVFLLLAAMFLPLEHAFSVRPQGARRRGMRTDLFFFLGQHLLFVGPVVAVLALVHANLHALPGESIRAEFGAMPYAVQFGLMIVWSDVVLYWAHRLSHQVPFLWRFHKVHHTSERLDWVAAYREHPVDNLYTRLVENVPAMLLGFPLYTIAGFAVFRGLWAIYIHSNCRLIPGPLRYVIGSSRLHHWHHEEQVGGRCNFANLSPLMDLMFGTYHDPGHFPDRYGIENERPAPYLQQIVEPLVPAPLWPKRFRESRSEEDSRAGQRSTSDRLPSPARRCPTTCRKKSTDVAPSRSSATLTPARRP
ncbi:MAG: sterol desaturase family protein [Planctomycetota bacterium]